MHFPGIIGSELVPVPHLEEWIVDLLNFLIALHLGAFCLMITILVRSFCQSQEDEIKADMAKLRRPGESKKDN